TEIIVSHSKASRDSTFEGKVTGDHVEGSSKLRSKFSLEKLRFSNVPPKRHGIMGAGRHHFWSIPQ
ncbi:MAG: hypothetical protein QOI98_3610, partial [Solirubrobacteraceae bacterium]|nr:hypothetical protein [Solirubrobacteraceae bacterium]